MFGKKVYGEYKSDVCVFCGITSMKKNSVGLPVCKNHENENDYPAYKCICGDWIDVMVGKFGAYCRCMRCGNINLQKIMEHNMNLRDAKNIQNPSNSPIAKRDHPPAEPKLSPEKETAMRYRIFLD